MPFNKSIYVLYYNQELLDRAGVGVPATMDELRAAAKAVKDKTGVYGFALKADIDHFGVFLHAFGGRWIEDGKTAFNGPEGVAALRFMQDLVLTDGSAYFHDGYLDEEFNVGNTAMFMATVATIPWVSNDLNWGASDSRRRGAGFARAGNRPGHLRPGYAGRAACSLALREVPHVARGERPLGRGYGIPAGA